MMAKPLASAIALAGPRHHYYRFWWLAIIVFSLMGWAVVIGAASLLASILG